MRYSDTDWYKPLSPKISAMCCKLLKMQNFTEILVLKKDLDRSLNNSRNNRLDEDSTIITESQGGSAKYNKSRQMPEAVLYWAAPSSVPENIVVPDCVVRRSEIVYVYGLIT